MHLDPRQQGVIQSNTWSDWLINSVPMDLRPGAYISMADVTEILKRTAVSIDVSRTSSKRTTTKVVFEDDGLQRFAAMCVEGKKKSSVYDLEILQEQLVEVGDEFSDEFKRGINAAVAVLLEKKHLEEFLV